MIESDIKATMHCVIDLQHRVQKLEKMEKSIQRRIAKLEQKADRKTEPQIVGKHADVIIIDEPQTCNKCDLERCETCVTEIGKTEPQTEVVMPKECKDCDSAGKEHVMDKSLNNYTLKEFQSIDNYNEKAVFDSIIIVPMEDLHDSGFRCMKGILVYHGGIVGSVGGWCDVVHPNGIGNYGRYNDSFSKLISSGLAPRMGLRMDCLNKSHCIRIMLDGEWQMDDFIGSDLCFYKSEQTERPRINPDCGWK